MTTTWAHPRPSMDEPASTPPTRKDPSSASLETQLASEPPETILFGRYRVLGPLGKGGMGRVVLALDTLLGVQVAVKILPEEVAGDPQAVAELRKEVLRGRAVAHPGSVRIFTLEQDASGAGIVMEHVEGANLAQLKSLQPTRCFDCDEILPWIEQLCATLDYAHRDAQIVHRDLKPTNLLVTCPTDDCPQGRIKIADFGLASTLSEAISRHSREGTSSGTPPYMSPQQSRGERPTALDDIYSLGATIYDLLTGKPPFYRGDIHTQLQNVVPPPMSVRRLELGVKGAATIPAWWEEAVAACLAKKPAMRPQSAGELLAWLSGRRPGTKDQPRRSVWWAPALGAAVLGAAMVVAILFSHHPASQRNEPIKQTPTGTDGVVRLPEASAAAPFVNGLGMKFVPVPIAGGATVLFATTETTASTYQRFIADTGRSWPAAGFVQEPDHPAVNVTWDDAFAFCVWLTEAERAAGRLPEGASYRLPSDHEWSCAIGIGEQEKAGQSPKEKRAALPSLFPWGSAWPPPPRAGNYADDSAKKGGATTHSIEGYDDGFARTNPVEAFAPNALGLFGLGDNVSEWCGDWYDPEKKDNRTVRGASWLDDDEVYLLSSFRGASPPTQRFAAYGFRCVIELPAGAR